MLLDTFSFHEVVHDDVRVCFVRADFRGKSLGILWDRDINTLVYSGWVTEHAYIMANYPLSVIPVDETQFVRMNVCHGGFILRSTASGGTSIEYYQLVEPGGSIPAWIINMGQTIAIEIAMDFKDYATKTLLYPELVFETSQPLGITRKGLTSREIGWVSTGKQAEELGVKPGWSIETINGKDVTGEDIIIYDEIKAAKTSGPQMTIIFKATPTVAKDPVPTTLSRDECPRLKGGASDEVEEETWKSGNIDAPEALPETREDPTESGQ